MQDQPPVIDAIAPAETTAAPGAYLPPSIMPPSAGRKRWPRPLTDAALIGLAGEFVNMVEPHTEADPAALFFQFAACFGNCVGTNHFFQIGRSKHHAREYVLIIGKSAKARKGTSLDWVRDVFWLADKIWSKRIVSGLGSGEGVINQVRDASEETDEHGSRVTKQGADDKRCMAIESEFASVLSVGGREGSTLTEILRAGWDSGNLQSLVKNNPIRATGAHIGVIGHITETELREKLKEVAIANGFANRFLPVCVKRSKMLPDGGNLPDEQFEEFARRLSLAIDNARKISRMIRSEEANQLWRDNYAQLTDWHERRAGSYGSITGRAEAHVVRLSICFALMDGQSEIQFPHMKAALECWRFCQESALYIWGDGLNNETAETIREGLASAGSSGLTRTEINGLFHGHIPAKEIDSAFETLTHYGMVEPVAQDSTRPGRKAKGYRLASRFAE